MDEIICYFELEQMLKKCEKTLNELLKDTKPGIIIFDTHGMFDNDFKNGEKNARL